MKPTLRHSIALVCFLLIVGIFLVVQTRTGEDLPTWPTSVPAGKIDFKKNVRPLLIINCLECHNNQNAPENGNLSLETKKLAMTTGNHAPVLIPGKPDESLLITVLTLDGIHKEAMPPTPDKIWGVRMEILRRWIEEGADWPEDIRLVHPREIEKW
jgi:hypothetical protein